MIQKPSLFSFKTNVVTSTIAENFKHISRQSNLSKKPETIQPTCGVAPNSTTLSIACVQLEFCRFAGHSEGPISVTIIKNKTKYCTQFKQVILSLNRLVFEIVTLWLPKKL